MKINDSTVFRMFHLSIRLQKVAYWF